MYKFNAKRLARYRYKQNQNPLHLWLDLYDLVSHQTLSVIAPIFLKIVFLKLPDRMSRWGFELVCEIFKVPIFDHVSSLDSVSEILISNLARVALNRRKY